jgi:hypothetical protein
MDNQQSQNKMENKGWICLYRKLLDSPIMTCNDPYLLKLWVYILLRVNHKQARLMFNGKELTLEAGQGIFGLNQIVRDLTGLMNEKKSQFKKFKTIFYRKLKILKL